MHMPVMESRDLLSVSKVSGLETLNIAKKWIIKISIIQRFLLYLQVRNNQNTSEERQEFEKNSSQKL